MINHALTFQSMNFFAMSIDKRNEKSLQNETWKREKNNVTNMFENLDWDFILSAKIHIKINMNYTHTFTFDIRSFCTYLFFKSNIHVFVIVTFNQTRFWQIWLDLQIENFDLNLSLNQVQTLNTLKDLSLSQVSSRNFKVWFDLIQVSNRNFKTWFNSSSLIITIYNIKKVKIKRKNY